MKGSMAMNILMTMLVANLLLFYAYPSSFDYSLVSGMENMGLEFTNDTLTGEYTFNITDTGSSVVNETFGVGGTTSSWVPDIVSNTIDWVTRTATFIFWVGSFLYAPSTIMATSGAPSLISNLFILIYTIGYLFALYEIITGR